MIELVLFPSHAFALLELAGEEQDIRHGGYVSLSSILKKAP